MRAAIGYERMSAVNYRPMIRVTSDFLNNVGRLCSYGKLKGRIWEIKVSMRDQEFQRWYLIENTLNGHRAIVKINDLHNLY